MTAGATIYLTLCNSLNLRSLGGGYWLCRNVFIHIKIQILPQVPDDGTGGRLCAFISSINLKYLKPTKHIIYDKQKKN